MDLEHNFVRLQIEHTVRTFMRENEVFVLFLSAPPLETDLTLPFLLLISFLLLLLLSPLLWPILCVSPEGEESPPLPSPPKEGAAA